MPDELEVRYDVLPHLSDIARITSKSSASHNTSLAAPQTLRQGLQGVAINGMKICNQTIEPEETLAVRCREKLKFQPCPTTRHSLFMLFAFSICL